VKVLCGTSEADELAASLANVAQVEDVEIAGPGPGAHLRTS
jgi:hypothetical protein